MDVAVLRDRSPRTCAYLPPPYSNGLLIMNVTAFTEIRVRLITTNLAVTSIDCHSSPVLLLINTGLGSMTSRDCRPLCGPPVTCKLESQSNDVTIWNCMCPEGSCKQIALAIAAGAFVDTTISAKLCYVDFVNIWYFTVNSVFSLLFLCLCLFLFYFFVKKTNSPPCQLPTHHHEKFS